MRHSLKVIPFGTFRMFLYGQQVDGSTCVKLLVGLEYTSTFIFPSTILNLRSKNSIPFSSATCIVNLILHYHLNCGGNLKIN